jgi:hypothetical protein
MADINKKKRLSNPLPNKSQNGNPNPQAKSANNTPAKVQKNAPKKQPIRTCREIQFNVNLLFACAI